MKINARLAGLAAIGLTISACTGVVPGRPPPVSQTPPAPSTVDRSPPLFAPKVRSPLDARGIKVCDLLEPDQLTQLGLVPGSGVAGVSGIAEVCTWRSSADPGNPAGLQLSTHPVRAALDNIYAIRDSYAVFEPLEIAGHPAVHADLTTATGCVIYTAIADYQGIAVGADVAGRPSADPCMKSRLMTEMILSNLPPLR